MSTMTGVDCIIFSFNSSHGYSEGRWWRAPSKLEVPDRGGWEEAFQRRGIIGAYTVWAPWMFPDTNKAGKCQLMLEKYLLDYQY